MADSQGSPSGSKKAKHSHAVLGEIDWKRIVGDEGHVLKNPKAKSKCVQLEVLTASDEGFLLTAIDTQVDLYWHTDSQLPGGFGLYRQLHSSLQATRSSMFAALRSWTPCCAHE